MMEIKVHLSGEKKIAEVISRGMLITNVADGMDLLGNLYYQDFDCIILHAKNISPVFFDLKNGMAGEILQKFSNYRVHLAIVGDFTNYQGASIHAFILESNKLGHVNFVSSTQEAIKRLSGK